ncbi:MULTISPECIES: CitMHS family transporter [unclassified Paenibacillus]|uniref:CitMHS family transporter n=1 Tax=unclassified Paenibacillus TaxID=185978 RepID=UPI0036258E8F
MLSILGFLMVSVFMYLIMSKRLSALVALILVPVVFALMGGFAPDLANMMSAGIKNIAPTGVLLIFGILYFGIMIDAGLFDPVVNQVLKLVKGDPLKIAVGTAVLVLVVSLDGDGATTFMITVSAMLPLYKKLKMNPLILACIAMMGNGVMNILPWGGPTARVMSSLHLESSQVFTPLIPALIASAAYSLLVAYHFGLKERKRLGVIQLDSAFDTESHLNAELTAALQPFELRRPKLLWFNFLLTLTLLVGLIFNVLPLNVMFMIATAVALAINYPNLKDQQKRIASHAGNALAVGSMVFAAGIFTGILSGTKMVDAMGHAVVALIPDSLGNYLAIITALTSMPFTFFMSNDAFYFGILPIIAEAAAKYGIPAEVIGRASLLGQTVHLLSPLVASTYLLVGLVGVNFGDHQRFTMKWAIGTTIVMLIVCLITGVI